MDPINHGLVGAAVGVSLVRDLDRSSARFARWIAVACGLVAGEAPDVDRIVDAWIKPFGPYGDGLAYMLYHRGITHTIAVGVAMATGIAVLFAFVGRHRGPSFARLTTIAVVALLLHLGMDAANDYGVHPFYPLSKRWVFGDFLFLGEPTIETALLPYVLAELGPFSRRTARITTGLGVAVFGYLVARHDWITLFGALVASAWLAAHMALQWRRPRPWLAWGSITAVLLSFFGCSRLAEARARRAIAARYPSETLSDVVTTPAAANPACWRVIVVTTHGDEFTARLGTTSLVSWLVNAQTCFAPPNGPAPLTLDFAKPTDLPNNHEWSWVTEFTARFSDFDRYARANARVAAARYFLRVPFWGEDRRCKCGRTVIGDLRVDYDPEDLGTYCKYSFPKAGGEALKCEPPRWDPPFLRVERTSSRP